MTDEQVNRIMSGQDKLWDTHGADTPYGPGLNVTSPRAGPTADELRDYGGYHIGPCHPVEDAFYASHVTDAGVYAGLGRHFDVIGPPPPVVGAAAPDEHFAPYPDDITEADIVETMRSQGLGRPPVALVTAGAICQQAADITAGDRQQQNGDKLPNHENIAALWSAYLGVPIDAHQAATMMVLLKVARTKLGAFNTDDYVDMAGYAGCAAEIRHRSNQEQQ